MTKCTPGQIFKQAFAGSRWLVKHQDPDGGWRGLRDPKVDAFYKASWALIETGQAAAANRSLTYGKRHFLSSDGDFPDRSHPWHVTVHYPYLNSYFVVGSALARRYDVAIPDVLRRIRVRKPRLGKRFEEALKVHRKILKEEGLGKYFLYSYHYRKRVVAGWLGK